MTIDDLVQYKNKINGIVYYAIPKQKPVIREGVEYLAVFEHLHRPRVVYIARSALERVTRPAKR